MTTLPTLVLEQDDERTVVDQCHRGAPPTSEATKLLPDSHYDSPQRQPSPESSFRMVALLARWRLLAFVIVTATMSGGLSVALYRERHVTNSLREALAALKRSHSRSAIEVAARSVEPPKLSLEDSLAAGRSTGAAPVDREELERQGADLLGANDFRAALAYYRLLSARFPNERVYLDFVTVLGAKLRCQEGKVGARCN
jgi:hypothetical protein